MKAKYIKLVRSYSIKTFTDEPGRGNPVCFRFGCLDWRRCPLLERARERTGTENLGNDLHPENGVYYKSEKLEVTNLHF